MGGAPYFLFNPPTGVGHDSVSILSRLVCLYNLKSFLCPTGKEIKVYQHRLRSAGQHGLRVHFSYRVLHVKTASWREPSPQLQLHQVNNKMLPASPTIWDLTAFFLPGSPLKKAWGDFVMQCDTSLFVRFFSANTSNGQHIGVNLVPWSHWEFKESQAGLQAVTKQFVTAVSKNSPLCCFFSLLFVCFKMNSLDGGTQMMYCISWDTDILMCTFCFQCGLTQRYNLLSKTWQEW